MTQKAFHFSVKINKHLSKIFIQQVKTKSINQLTKKTLNCFTSTYTRLYAKQLSIQHLKPHSSFNPRFIPIDIFDAQNQFCNCLCPTQFKKDRYHLRNGNYFQERTGKDLDKDEEYKHGKQHIINIRHIPNKSN